MIRKIFQKIFGKTFWKNGEIAPDEIFLDSSNIPEFNVHQFEGRIEKAIPRTTIAGVGVSALLVALLFLFYAGKLQIVKGSEYADRSQNNHLRHEMIFAKRGIIFDRNGEVLVENISGEPEEEFLRRKYLDISGLSHVVGYVKYPRKDKSGFYYVKDISGFDGVEKMYNAELSGGNGLKITETNAHGKIVSESVIRPPEDGKNLTLTIDSRLQSRLYDYLAETAESLGFKGGTGVLFDVKNGEILALGSYPEYRSEAMAEGKNSKLIRNYINNKNEPFLNRAVSGSYTPGSIIKPFMAAGVLREGIIDPAKKILSTGSISVSNPYNPKEKSVFVDWRPQGWVDIRRAIAVSSNVYFYEVGGGFEGQKGLGITNIEKYARLFGLGSETGVDLSGEVPGAIPSPSWKEKYFPGDPWRLGDTYHTVIGQYGFQVTPLQMARGIGAIANGGVLLRPHIVKEIGNEIKISAPVSEKKTELPDGELQIVREGMRQTVTEGTAPGLKVEYVRVAAKTGTAQVGINKKYINAWVVGFFPYENPRYSFVILMEKGPDDGGSGAVRVMHELFDWMRLYASEYLK